MIWGGEKKDIADGILYRRYLLAKDGYPDTLLGKGLYEFFDKYGCRDGTGINRYSWLFFQKCLHQTAKVRSILPGWLYFTGSIFLNLL